MMADMARLDLKGVLSGDAPEADWLIRGVIPKGCLAVLAGDAGVGKSSLTYYVALCVASGMPFFGRPVYRTRVLVCDDENSNPDMTSYIHTLWTGLGCPDVDVITPNLRIEHYTVSESAARPIETLTAMIDDFKPGLIVLDTVNPILRTKDENSNAEATAQVAAVRKLMARAEPGCVALCLRHARVDKDTGRDIRGAKSWRGAPDMVLFHHRARGRPKDGLYVTILEASKVRAFGLRERLTVTPTRPTKGCLLLSGAFTEKD